MASRRFEDSVGRGLPDRAITAAGADKDGTCAYCLRRGLVFFSGRRWLCAECRDDHMGCSDDV